MNASEKKEILQILLDLLDIPSPTFHEERIFQHLRSILKDFAQYITCDDKNGMIFSFHVPGLVSSRMTEHVLGYVSEKSEKNHQESSSNIAKHIAFLAHVDVVPKYSPPYVEGTKVYGAGASDMKSGLAAFVYLLLYCFAEQKNKIKKKSENNHRVSFIFYAAEETSQLQDNGLFGLIKKKKKFFQSIDFAVVGEPTDRTLQLGSVGSSHAKVRFTGISCHSARPWQGENALYKASHFISTMSLQKPILQKVFDLDFFDTINITESQSAKGPTIIPGWWEANVNFRFAPCHTIEEAKEKFIEQLVNAGAEEENIYIFSMVYAGTVTDNEFFRLMLKKLQKSRKKLKIEPKQAWTDVAQLGELKIPCLNYGPGLTEQCHKPEEYTLLQDLVEYTDHLMAWLKDIELIS